MPSLEDMPEDAKEALKAMNPEEEAQETEPVESTESVGDDSSANVDDATATEETSEASDGQEAVAEPPAEDDAPWYDETEIAFGQSYGLSDEEIHAFESKEEFRRAMQVFDRHILGNRQTQPTQPQQPEQQQEQTPAPVPQQESQFERVKLDPDEYDEPLVKFVDSIQDRLEAYEQRFAAQENAQLQAEHNKRIQEFETYVDSLGREDLFGTPEERSNLNSQMLSKLWEDSHQVERDSYSLGVTAPFTAFIERAVQVTHPQAQKRQRSAQQDSKILQQSQQRLGGGQSTHEAPTAWDGEAKDNPQLIDAYQRMIQENGSKH